jgi:hypothetical protein
VDWHDYNANLHTAQAKEFFSKMAQAYPATANIIWEIWNEPDHQNGTGSAGWDSWTDIKTYADSIIAEIRKYSSNLVVVGTPMWSSDPETAAGDPVADSNVAYAFHFYAGSHDVSARANPEAAMRKGAAVFITEFGLTDAAGGVTNKTVFPDETATWLDWADNKRISWVNWSLSNFNQASSALKAWAHPTGNWPDTLLSASGTFICNRLRTRSAEQSSDSASIFAAILGKGAITVSPGKTVKKGSAVTLSAAAAGGWTFESWAEGSTSTENPLTLTVTDNISLAAKFIPDPGTNMIKNGTFSGSQNWSSWVADGSKAAITFADSQVNFKITKTDTIDWTIQVTQTGLAVDSGVEYTITLDAWSTAYRNLTVWLVTDQTYVDVGGDTIRLTPIKQKHTVKVTAPFSSTRCLFQLFAGKDTLPVFADNIQMYRSVSARIIGNHRSEGRFGGMHLRRTGDRIHWTPASPRAKAVLLNCGGRIVKPASGVSPIRLTDLPAGIYMLALDDGAGKKFFHRIPYVSKTGFSK